MKLIEYLRHIFIMSFIFWFQKLDTIFILSIILSFRNHVYSKLENLCFHVLYIYLTFNINSSNEKKYSSVP